MYNKVLKRPMFNMGGRINQAAGTGITSGFDTP
jgi:class 3 adenylate cyclase